MIYKILPPLVGGGPISKTHIAFERRNDSTREALTHGVWIFFFFFFERMAWYLDFGGLKYPSKSLIGDDWIHFSLMFLMGDEKGLRGFKL